MLKKYLKHGSVQTEQWTDVHVGKIAECVAGGNENIFAKRGIAKVLRQCAYKKFQFQHWRLTRLDRWEMILNLSPVSTPAEWKSHPKHSSPQIKKTNWHLKFTWNLVVKKCGLRLRLRAASPSLFFCHTRVENIIPNMRKGRTCNRLMTSHFPHHFT